MSQIFNVDGVVRLAQNDYYLGTGRSSHLIQSVVWGQGDLATGGICRGVDGSGAQLVPAVGAGKQFILDGAVSTSGGICNTGTGDAFVYLK